MHCNKRKLFALSIQIKSGYLGSQMPFSRGLFLAMVHATCVNEANSQRPFFLSFSLELAQKLSFAFALFALLHLSSAADARCLNAVRVASLFSLFADCPSH